MSERFFGFAAVADGRVDVRTVSSTAYAARRLALLWLFNMGTTVQTDETYVEFLWKSAVAVRLGRDPTRTVEIRSVSIEIIEGVPEPDFSAPPVGETPQQRSDRLKPPSEGDQPVLVGAQPRPNDGHEN